MVAVARTVPLTEPLPDEGVLTATVACVLSFWTPVARAVVPVNVKVVATVEVIMTLSEALRPVTEIEVLGADSE